MNLFRTAALAALVLALPLAACSGGSDAPTAIELPIDRLVLVGSCSPMVPQDVCQLAVEAYTAEGQRIGNPVLRWFSLNANIASVSGDGLVTAKTPGEATIRVTNTTESASDQVTIHVLPLNPK